MEKNNEKEEGMEEYKLWRRGSLRGYPIIGKYIIQRYKLTDENIRIMKRSSRKVASQTYRDKKRVEKAIEPPRI